MAVVGLTFFVPTLKINVFLHFRREDKSDPCYSILDRRESLQVILASPGIFIFKLYANEKIKQTSKAFFKQVG